MSTSWTAVEDALHAWVVSASGLDNAHVIWDTPNAHRPTGGTFITLRMGDILTHGIDELTGTDNSGGTPGVNDYVQTVTSRREFTLTVQCFGPPSSGHLGPQYGDNGTVAVLSRVQAALALPGTMDGLAAAGVSNFDPGTIGYVPALVGTVFEGRARMEPRFYALETATGYTTYIATVSPIGITFNH